MGTLDSQGYKYFVEGGVLRVSEGGPTVIKGKLHNGLYFLQDSNIVSATVVSSCLNIDCDITHLCHMTLEHMSDIWISVLSKSYLLGGQKISPPWQKFR